MLVEFTTELHKFLIGEGYTHIILKGVQPFLNLIEPGTPPRSSEDYHVEPILPTDSRLSYEESNIFLMEMADNDVIDMAAGFPLISFYAEVKTDIYQKYLNQ